MSLTLTLTTSVAVFFFLLPVSLSLPLSLSPVHLVFCLSSVALVSVSVSISRLRLCLCICLCLCLCLCLRLRLPSPLTDARSGRPLLRGPARALTRRRCGHYAVSWSLWSLGWPPGRGTIMKVHYVETIGLVCSDDRGYSGDARGCSKNLLELPRC